MLLAANPSSTYAGKIDAYLRVHDEDESPDATQPSAWRARQYEVFDHLFTCHQVPLDLPTHTYHMLTKLPEGEKQDETGYLSHGRCSGMEILIAADAPEGVTIHEIAHWIDMHLGQTFAMMGGRDEDDLTSGHPSLDALNEAFARDPLCQHIAQLLDTDLSEQHRSYLAYFASPIELFARAYTQWALTGSRWAEQVSWYSDITERHGVGRIAHWSAEDFVPIGAAVGAAMGELTQRRVLRAS